MPRQKLSALWVEAAKPPAAGRVEHFDKAMPGFGLRITASGVKSWILFYRVDGRQVRQTLGQYPLVSLADARQKARDALALVERGQDPRREIADERQAQARHRANTFGAVAEEFHTRHLDKLRRGHKAWRTIELDALPVRRDRPIREIGRADVFRLLDSVEDRGAPYSRNRLLAAVRRLFNFALERELVDANPAARIRALAEEKRQRVLSDDELRALWAAFVTMGYPFGDLLRFLLVTVQRRSEGAGSEWPEIDLGAAVWLIPGNKSKNGLDHRVALSPLAVDILASVPRFTDPCIFTTTGGKRPVSGFSKAKAEADKRSGVTDWVIHDLRRTGATAMAAAGVDRLHIARVLNHTDRTVTAIYDRHRYEFETRNALATWAQRLQTILNPPDDRDKVVKIRG